MSGFILMASLALATVPACCGATPGIEIVAPPDTFGLAGDEVRLPITLRNGGPESVFLQIRIQDSAGWVRDTLALGGEVVVPPGAATFRTIPLQIPAEASGGAADFVSWQLIATRPPADTLRGVVGVTSRADTDAPVPVLIAEPFSRWVTLRFAGRAVEGLTGAVFYRSAPGEPETRITPTPVPFENDEPVGRFTDTLAAPGRLYAYRLAVVTAGGFEASMIGVTARTSPGVDLSMGEARVDAEVGGWSWVLTVPRHGQVEVTVIDMAGRRLRTIRPKKSSAMGAGDHRITWDGRDDSGIPVSGLVRLVATQGKARTSRDLVILGDDGVTPPH